VADVRLIVNGTRHGGWKTIAISRSIESISGTFSLSISDKWLGQNNPWPILEEDRARVEIDGDPVVDGFVDSREVEIGATNRDLSYNGRDKSGALVDNSVLLDGRRWTFRKLGVVEIAKQLATPFGISVATQPGLVLPEAARKTVVNPGDTAFEVIARAAAQAGVLVVGDGLGGITITRAGTRRVEPLILGRNIKTIGVSYNATERFSRYVLVTQTAGTDTASGAATRIRAEARDLGVRREDRVLVVRPEAGMAIATGRRRVNWEANVRRGRAQTVTVTVQGWRQQSGDLWPVNALAEVEAVEAGVNGPLLISRVDYSTSIGEGQIARLTLVDPLTFTPEPVAKKAAASGGWKELRKGA